MFQYQTIHFKILCALWDALSFYFKSILNALMSFIDKNEVCKIIVKLLEINIDWPISILMF